MAQSEGGLRTDVVIVGGGLAGLTTAVGLAGSGLSTIVLERDEILGGRARCWTDPVTGDSVTVGPHIFLSEYPNMMKVLRGLGTENKVVWQRGKFITIMDGRKETVIRMRRLPPPFHYLPCILKERDFFPVKDIASNRKAAFFCLSLSEEDILKVDRTNALSALRRLGVSEDFIRRFWAFTAMSIMNVPIERCSAGSLFRFFKLMASHKYYEVGFADGGLGDLFAPQAKAAIERAGGKVLNRVEVKSVTGHNGRAAGVTLADGTRISARWVVIAVPPTDMGRLLP
ncbi:MAG: FAD-dependent oxidoreductase, partial [Thermodesulfobacteriota bacterium]